MKINRQEAQRVRESPLHDRRQPLAAVSSPSVTAPDPTATPSKGFNRLRQRLAQWLASRSEPQITAITDRAGQIWWRAYNPRTQDLKWLDSEAEVRLWLDTQPCF
ncbi:MAG: hypothetical protein HC812_10515 [Leptolyngbya sp. RL_3_1]|nr:hypothetical protein [Leptolyngbya sp. RL_3_1]